MRRKLLGLAGLGTWILAGTVVFRRSFSRRPDRVDVYFDDGSLVTFVNGSIEADGLLPVARDALTAVRS